MPTSSIMAAMFFVSAFLATANAQSPAAAELPVDGRIQLVKGKWRPLIAAVSDRVEQSESSRLAVTEREIELRRLKSELEQARVAVDLGEAAIKQYTEVTFKSEVAAIDAEMTPAQENVTKIEQAMTLFRATQSAPKPGAYDVLARAKAVLEGVKYKKRVLMEFSKEVKIRELQLKVEESRVKVEILTDLLALRRTQLEQARFASAMTQLSAAEKKAISRVEPIGRAWDEVRKSRVSLYGDDQAKHDELMGRVEALRGQVEELDGQWGQCQADRGDELNALRRRRLQQVMDAGKPSGA